MKLALCLHYVVLTTKQAFHVYDLRAIVSASSLVELDFLQWRVKLLET